MPIKRAMLRMVCWPVVVMLVGCGGDDIRRYQVAKIEALEPKGDSHGGGSLQRMLAAIVPHGDRTWFFKLVGPRQAVDEQQEAFDRFVRSIHFPAGQEIAWAVPEGWRHEPGSGMRYATLRTGRLDQSLELTVIPLDGESASVLLNVNRWRGQLGLAPVGDTELAQITTELELDGAHAIRVDMSGPGESKVTAKASRGRSSLPSAVSEPQGGQRPTLNYTRPDGWLEQTDPRGFRVAAFQVTDGDRRAEVTVIPLNGPAGGLLQNVNRWREQVRLMPVNEDQLRQEIQQIEVAGTTAAYADLIGPESAGDKPQRILGVVVERGEQTWFFKMTGPADLVAKQKAAFEGFVRSVRFD